MKNLELLVIHCTATPGDRNITGLDIRLMHTSPPPMGRGWKQVGYTDLVRLNGYVERLVDNNEDNMVDSWEITNGVAGMNSKCRNIVYAGGIDKKGKPLDTRTEEQTESLEIYVTNFIARFPKVKVAGHYQLDKNKACPSFDVPAWLQSIGIPSKNIY